MELFLRRCAANRNRTIGLLFVGNDFLCFTLEDRIRMNKVAGETAIPHGTYDVRRSWSPKFEKQLPEILNVPGFEGIRIHAGNTAEDSSGCILIGMGWDGRSDAIVRSREAMDVLDTVLRMPCTITIAPVEYDPDGSNV